MSQFIELHYHGTNSPKKVTVNVDHVVKVMEHVDGSAVLTLASITKDGASETVHASEKYQSVKEAIRYGKDLD